MWWYTYTCIVLSFLTHLLFIDSFIDMKYPSHECFTPTFSSPALHNFHHHLTCPLFLFRLALPSVEYLAHGLISPSCHDLACYGFRPLQLCCIWGPRTPYSPQHQVLHTDNDLICSRTKSLLLFSMTWPRFPSLWKRCFGPSTEHLPHRIAQPLLFPPLQLPCAPCLCQSFVRPFFDYSEHNRLESLLFSSVCRPCVPAHEHTLLHPSRQDLLGCISQPLLLRSMTWPSLPRPCQGGNCPILHYLPHLIVSTFSLLIHQQPGPPSTWKVLVQPSCGNLDCVALQFFRLSSSGIPCTQHFCVHLEITAISDYRNRTKFLILPNHDLKVL